MVPAECIVLVSIGPIQILLPRHKEVN